jgi:hypothetical protein
MVRGRFCVKRCRPSRHRLRDASAALENFARHPKKTFQHYLPATDFGAAMRSSRRRGACRFSPNRCTSAPVQNLFLSHSHVTEIFFSVKYLLFVCRLIEPKPPGFVMWIATFGNILADGSPRMTQLSVGLDNKRIRLSNDWKAHVLGKAIRSVGGHVP